MYPLVGANTLSCQSALAYLYLECEDGRSLDTPYGEMPQMPPKAKRAFGIAAAAAERVPWYGMHCSRS